LRLPPPAAQSVVLADRHEAEDDVGELESALELGDRCGDPGVLGEQVVAASAPFWMM
jgi:hypothetical protein